MNKKRLNEIFAKYIERFEFLNNADNDESYKWRIAQMWQDRFDLEAEDLGGMLYEICRRSDNLIDNKNQLPFTGVIEYARREPETVREMFRELFSADGGDLDARQRRIRAFIDKTEALRQKYYPDSWKFVNDQRSVMTFLFLHDPEHNYMYKWSQAKEFADCVEFMDDWDSGADFKLPVYYRMCDELVATIKNSPELLKTHASRFDNQTEPMYRDDSYHILAFDVIYCCLVYGLYNGIKYDKIKSKDRQLAQERRKKANELYAALEETSVRAEQIDSITTYLNGIFCKDAIVWHKVFGEGIVQENDGMTVSIRFEGMGQPKKFVLLSAVSDGFLGSNDPRFEETLENGRDVMKSAQSVRAAKDRAATAFAPYAQYFDPEDTAVRNS